MVTEHSPQNRRRSQRRCPSRHRIIAATLFVAIAALGAASCAGDRPYFATDGGQIDPPLVLDLAPAPAGTSPLPATSADFPAETSVDDAIASWARDRSIPYTDSCARVTPQAGQLCDSPTERDTVRLLGPSENEHWYVVTVAEEFDIETGRGYRVESVAIAGR